MYSEQKQKRHENYVSVRPLTALPAPSTAGSGRCAIPLAAAAAALVAALALSLTMGRMIGELMWDMITADGRMMGDEVSDMGTAETIAGCGRAKTGEDVTE